MADIAAIFHWPPAVMWEMPVDELFSWQRLAAERWNRMQGSD